MRILLDNCVPRKLAPQIAAGYEVCHCQEMGWDTLSNGKLLAIAQLEFDVMITTDSGIPFQQRLSQFDIAIIVAKARLNRTEDLVPLVPNMLEAIQTVKPGQYVFVM